MRVARIVEEGAGYYHVISRVVGREKVFRKESEREAFRKTMRAVEGFSGAKVLMRIPAKSATQSDFGRTLNPVISDTYRSVATLVV